MLSGNSQRTTTTNVLRNNETQVSDYEHFLSELGDLRIRISRLENVESTRMNSEACTEKTAQVEQLLSETAELREVIGTLRSKISHFETLEVSLLSKIADIEGLLGSKDDSDLRSTSCHLEEQEQATGETWEDESAINRRDREEVEEDTLPNDTFSFMIIAPSSSTPLFLSLIVAFFQITAFSLVASSIIAVEDSKNPFSIPANVTSTVRFTQIIAIVIALITQDDIRTGLNLFLEGYENESICKAFPKVTLGKWMLSIITRLMEGSLSLVVTFLLIVTAETVVDLLLNFTAMQFVSQLDEVCFFMCLQGFFGRTNAITAKRVAGTTFHKVKDERKGHIHRTVFLVFLLVVLFASWFTIAHNQNSGKYQCSTVFVQFPDEFNHRLGTFSGLYDQRSSGTGIFSARNFEYADRLTGKGVLSYCENLEAWTFTTVDEEGKIDPCNWLAISGKTTTFDLMETASSTWIARNSIWREAVLEPFFLSCYECDDVVTSGNDSRCSSRGRCENAICVCDDGWYGLRCEFREPCQTLEFDNRFGPFQDNHKWSSVYSRFEHNSEFVETYHRPVYINEQSNGVFDILVFLGRRWAATTSALLPVAPKDGESAKEALARYLSDNFHPSFLLNFSLAFTSEPVDVGTSLDGTSPIGLAWYAFPLLAVSQEEFHDDVEDTLTLIPSMLLCAVCDNITNACRYDGECFDGSCHCSVGSSGALCQTPPVGNGRCDLFFNTLEFEYDGGDCCESTCVSSTQFTCGRDESDFVDLGYFFCHLPEEGWRVNSEFIAGDDHSGSGHVVQLSGNGKILAVSEPGFDHVLLFDKVGSQWIQRGRPIEGQPGTFFGISVAMSSDLVNMYSNPITKVPVMIAVGNSFRPIVYVSVFDCSSNGCSQVGDDIVAFESRRPILGVVDISDDGGIVVAGARPVPSPETSSFPYPLAIFRRDIHRGVWTLQEVDINFRESEGVYSLALSANGEVLAIASFEAGFSGGSGPWIANNTRRVYTWSETFWDQRGSPIVEITTHRSLLFDLQGQSMDLSSDGNVLACGLWMKDVSRSTWTRIFAWKDSESDWIQQGSPVSCGEMELQGWSISLSSDGAIVAIGAEDYSGVEDFALPRVNGAICSFRWDGFGWVSLGNPLSSGGWSSVSLSSLGSELAVGLQGESVTYKIFHNSCPNGTSVLRLTITTDANPHLTTWSVISNQTGETLLQGGPYSAEAHMFASFVEEACVLQGDCLIFTIYDNLDLNTPPESNGINTPGGFALYIDGERIPGGNVTHAVERVHIGNCLPCPVGTRLFRMLIQTCAPIAWKLVSSYGKALFSKNSFDKYFHRFDNDCKFPSQTSYWEEVCLPLDDCSLLSILAPPVKMLDSTFGSNGTTGTNSPQPNLQYRLFLGEDEIASNTTRVFGGSEQNEFVVSMSVGNCAP